MYLCDYGGDYTDLYDYGLYEAPSVSKSVSWSWPLSAEGCALWKQWAKTHTGSDQAISGVLADWRDDHRDDLLTGATGPDPAGRLDLLIHWLREVRCFGRENVPA